MPDDRKQTYTIRLSEPAARLVEQAAQAHGTTPTAVIQSVIARKFGTRESAQSGTKVPAETAIGARLEALRKHLNHLELTIRGSFEQLRFEIVKTRAALFHSLDQTLSAELVDRIIEASDQTAREYIAGLEPRPESSS